MFIVVNVRNITYIQERWLEAVDVPRQAHAGADGLQGQGGGC